jgi:hypothetical protein
MSHLEEQHASLLPYHMMICCNTRGLRALLHGAFFEPSVPCNLVSPWLEGASTTIDALIQKKDYFQLGNVLGRRQPQVTALWLGVIILGMESRIFDHVRTGMSAVETLAAAWTSTTHSFLGPGQFLPASYEGTKISRTDVCRLLYLVEMEDHSRVPICPWTSFGDTELSDSSLFLNPLAAHHSQNSLDSPTKG